jgi:hypothetical protein
MMTRHVHPVLLAMTLVVIALQAVPAHAFEDVGDADILDRGPTMGPIDVERPPPKYLLKDRWEDVSGESKRDKVHEDFTDMTLEMRPLHASPLPRWGVELRLGPYRPTFARRAAGHALYDAMYVNDDEKSLFAGRPVMMGVELDSYILRTLGLLGVYGRVGYWRATGSSRACVAADGATPVSCTPDTLAQSIPGNDIAGLTALPVSLGAIWRLDMLKRHTPVPLLFTLKGGLDYHMWWGSSGGKRARYMGQAARGATLGYQGSVGVSLNMDGFAKRALSRIRSKVENNLFIEYALIRGHALAGKNRHDRIDFTDNRVITVGLACDIK